MEVGKYGSVQRSGIGAGMASGEGALHDPADVVTVTNRAGRGRVVLVCDHASNIIPERFDGLGLDEAARHSHIAWDPGALPVAQLLSRALDAPLIASGLSRLPEGTVEIGWRLAPEFWGRGYASEAARAWLDRGFRDMGLDEIVSFAVRDNLRSVAVMQRIGMVADPGRDFDHPGVPDELPQLKPHVFYALKRSAWLEGG